MNQIKTWFIDIKRLIALLPWTLNLLWQSHKGATLGLSIFTIIQAIIPVGQLWLGKLLIDQVVVVIGLNVEERIGEPTNLILFYLGLEASLLLGAVLIGLVAGHIRNILQEHLVYHVQLLVLNQSARLDLQMYESPDYYNQMRRAQQQAMYGPMQLLDSLLSFSESSLTLISVSVLIFAYQPLIFPLLVLTTIPSFWAMMYYGQKRFLLFNNRTPDGRLAEYLSSILSSYQYAKEVRLWGLVDHFIEQVESLRGRFKQENIDLSRGQAIATFGGELLSTIGYYTAYLLVVFAVIAGRLTVGDLSMYAGVFSRSQSLFEQLLDSVARMYEIQLFVEQLDIFLNYQPTIKAIDPEQSPPSLYENGLSVKNLTFIYPDTDRIVLHNVNFNIQPGECIAFVGENGAGKTTLVKCLLRLYDIDDGSISVGDVDLHHFNPDEWRQQIAAVFQDYARYHLTVQENIGLGNLEWLDDEDRIQHAAREAGIDDVLESLPQKYHSLLGRTFEGGNELSIGQWQRVALARALLRDAPLLILDEPTAAMDAQAEYDLYKTFRDLTKDRITLLISHRFSTVRMADRIFVLEKGTIIEEGNHDELMAYDGHYAHLFKLQAESYQMDGSTPAPNLM